MVPQAHGRIDLAIEALETALAADSDEPLIRYNLACYHSVAGDKRHALAYLEQALALDPNYRLLIDHEPDFDPLARRPRVPGHLRRLADAGIAARNKGAAALACDCP